MQLNKSMASQQQQRRKYPRRQFLRPVGVLIHGKYVLGLGREIGEGGMLFHIPIKMNEQDQMLLNFRIPEMEFCVVRCELRSKQTIDGKLYYGVQFLSLDYESKRSIREHIAAKTAEEAAKEIIS